MVRPVGPVLQLQRQQRVDQLGEGRPQVARLDVGGEDEEGGLQPGGGRQR